MDERKTVRIGIDYGTSTSKIVCRDASALQGEKAYVLRRNKEFRIPSSVLLSNDELWFGLEPAGRTNLGTWYHSVKMRVAGEITGDYGRYCYGPIPHLPDSISAVDLAILTVWFLRAEARRLSTELVRRPARAAFTVGVPMSFYEETSLRKTFLRIARSAQWLDDQFELLGWEKLQIQQAKQFLSFVPADLGSSVPDSDVREWIRSEAEAAMCLAVKSPSVADGPFAEVDIGAGTTNASVFQISAQFQNKRWLKDRLTFFSACSVPFGMDAVDEAIARKRGIPKDECLSLRGSERQLLAQDTHYAYGTVLSEIREGYRRAYLRASQKFSVAEREQFRQHQVFVTGGGSLIESIAREMEEHPSRYSDKLKIRALETPADLFDKGQRASSSDLVFLAAAYGLSFDAMEMPEPYTPDRVATAHNPERPKLNWEDM